MPKMVIKMINMSLLLRVVGFLVCSLLQCSADQLDVYFFNVGQASFTLLKTDEEAVVIDCGTKRKSENEGRIHGKMKAFVSNLLGGIRPIVFISHMDDDHYCGLDDFFPNGKRKKVIVGGIGEGKMPSILKSADVQFFEYKANGRQWINNILQKCKPGQGAERLFIGGQGSDSLKVACFFPKNNNVTTNSNEQSLVIKVTYAGKNILFPGDCSATLLEKLSKTESSSNFFGDIDVFVFSHHGDGRNGEFNLYGAVHEISKNRVPSYSIISSNPAKVNHIPKSEIALFGDPRFSGVTKGHGISVYNLKEKKVEEISNFSPIYVTCDSQMAYKLMISSNGKWIDLKDVDFEGKELKSGCYPP
jgi:beta-lactamase superfamily II metal-dependent hydrolase